VKSKQSLPHIDIPISLDYPFVLRWKVYNDKIEVTYVVIESATKLTIGVKFDAEEAAYFVPFISKSF
jgi:hypothetical protein